MLKPIGAVPQRLLRRLLASAPTAAKHPKQSIPRGAHHGSMPGVSVRTNFCLVMKQLVFLSSSTVERTLQSRSIDLYFNRLLSHEDRIYTQRPILPTGGSVAHAYFAERTAPSRLTIPECAPIEETVDAVAGNGLVVQASALQSQKGLGVGSQARPSCPDQLTPEVDRCSYCGLANCLQPQHVPVQAFLQKAITDYTLVMERTPIDLSEQCNH